MGFVYFVLAGIGLMIFVVTIYTIISEKSEKRAKNIEILQRMSSQTNKYIDKVSTLKTTSAKIDNCEKAIDTMKMALAYPEYEEVFGNFNSMMAKLVALKKVLPVNDYINKADKHAFKKNDKAEKNSLLDALYEIESSKVTDQDFKLVHLTNDNTGEEITKDYVEKRLEALGWER